MNTAAVVATIMEESISIVAEPAAAAAAEGAPEEEATPPEEAGTAIRRSTANKPLETSKPSPFLSQLLIELCWIVVIAHSKFHQLTHRV
jgi:hypothetical protein